MFDSDFGLNIVALPIPKAFGTEPLRGGLTFKQRIKIKNDSLTNKIQSANGGFSVDHPP